MGFLGFFGCSYLGEGCNLPRLHLEASNQALLPKRKGEYSRPPTFCRVTARSYGLGAHGSREAIYGRFVTAHPYGRLQSKKAQI